MQAWKKNIAKLLIFCYRLGGIAGASTSTNITSAAFSSTDTSSAAFSSKDLPIQANPAAAHENNSDTAAHASEGESLPDILSFRSINKSNVVLESINHSHYQQLVERDITAEEFAQQQIPEPLVGRSVEDEEGGLVDDWLPTTNQPSTNQPITNQPDSTQYHNQLLIIKSNMTSRPDSGEG